MQHTYRNQKGQFAPLPPQKADPANIRNGSLYGYKGIGVRAITKTQGKVLVCFHKTLMGLVEPEELSLLSDAQVKSYLGHANSVDA